jgi:hypothetical protein
MIRRLLLILVLLAIVSPAEAAIYYKPTWDNLLKAMVRYGALDLSDNKILDEFAIVTECDLYQAFHENDFKWNNVRDSIRQSVQMNLSNFPANFAYQDKVALGEYDFQNQIFRMSDHNPLQKVNAFFLFRTDEATCKDTQLHYVPPAFRAILDESVTLPGLPLTPRVADALLHRMDANNNKERIIYVRFNLHINYIGKVEPDTEPGTTIYVQHGGRAGIPILMNSQIDTIDFFEDERYSKLIWSYQP